VANVGLDESKTGMLLLDPFVNNDVLNVTLI